MTVGEVLILLNGPSRGAEVPLDPDAAAVTIGRDAARDLPLDDHAASRLHARVWFDGGGWQIEDCASRNGTWVNGRRIDRAALAAGDLIRVGDRLIAFSRDDRESAGGDLAAAVLAQSTVAARAAGVERDATVARRLQDEPSAPASAGLSRLCRLTLAMHEASDSGALARLVADELRPLVGAERVHVLLRDGGGAVRDAAASKAAGRAVHLLGRMAIDRDEALLVALPGGSVTAAERGTSLAVPIPGTAEPRGVVECHRAIDGEPFDRNHLELVMLVAHALGLALANTEHARHLERSNEQLRGRVARQGRLLGRSPAIEQLREQLHRAAASTAVVLVTGESGTGKELVAGALHEFSPRRNGPFVAVNCAAISESLLESELFGHEPGAFTGAVGRRVGQFERAAGGTIFLDEVGEMSPACQAKLLRLLEGHPFERLGGSEPVHPDVRVVAATHRQLSDEVGRGQFREDLYYRLRVVELHVPPLRDRGDDVVLLAAHFLEDFRRQTGRGPERFSPAALEMIGEYAWPGNVRELRNAIERAVVLGQASEVLPEDLALAAPGRAASGADPLVALADAERRHIQRVLRATGGNKTQACKILRIGRGTLYKKLAE